MRDIPCRYGVGCRDKDSGCNFLHTGDDQTGQNNNRRGGPPTGPRRTKANAISIGGVNRWGKPRSSGSQNPSTAWNLPTQSNPSAGISTETVTGFGGNSGWGSSDNNNASTSKDTGWNTGETSSRATNDATSGWGGPVSLDNGGWGGDFGGNKDTTSGWGTTPQDNGWGSNNSGGNNNATSGWDQPEDDRGWGPTNAAGGSNDATSGSGAAAQANGGWESSNSGGNNDNGGWGTNPADTAKSSDVFKSNHANTRSSRGQDQPTSSFGSLESGTENSSDGQKDKGKGMMRVDVHMRDLSPSRKQDEPKPKCAPPSPCISESPAQTPLSPRYAVPLSAISPKIPPDFKSMALEVAKLKTSPIKIKCVEGRKAFYKNVIKHTKNAIIAFLEQQEAQTDLNRWKNTQMSAIYGHATQKTRRVLDSERATYRQRLQDVEEAFQQAINVLMNLPESRVSDNKKKVNVLTKEVVAQYTQELQDWFKDLELHKRLLMEKKEEEEGEIITEEAEEGELIDPEEENTGQSLSELLRSGECTWNKLVEAIGELEKSFDATQTTVYFDIFTCIDDDSKEKLRQARTSLHSIEQEETKEDVLPAISAKIATAGESLERQTEELARLLNEIAVLENQVEAVRVQTTEATLVCQLAGRLFGEFEQWKEVDNAQITAITEQMQLLRLHNTDAPPTSASQDTSVVAAAVPSSSSWSTPESIPMSDLIDPIRRLIIDTIRKELEVCFENLRHRCIENQQMLESELEEEAKNIMLKAEIVKSRITPSKESSVVPVVPPNHSNVPLATHSRAPS